MEDIQSVSLEREENISTRKKVKELENKSPSSITPSRKSARGHGPKTTNQGDENTMRKGRK